MAYNWKNAALFGPLGGFFGGKKKGKGIQTYTPPPYSGPRPYTGEAVGYGADQLKTLAGAYLPALMARARGESGVGFDPAYRNTLKTEFLKDFGDYEGDVYSKSSGQASGQGLRGGIPMSIQAENTKNLSRARESGLADIDLRDLEARREDINNAFYQQPEEVTRGAGIQQNAANFGLAEYEATSPQPYLQPREPSILPSLIQAGATLGGAYIGGPAGATVGNKLGQTVANKYVSYNDPFLDQYSQDPFGQYRASLRRH